MTKALIYCRVSDTKQKTEGHGLESQEHRCRQHAAVRGYTVEQVFADDASGGGDFMNRPALVSMLHYLDQHKQQSYVIIFDDLKRLARDTQSHLRLRQALTLRGAKVECLNFKFEDTPEGEFIETILAAQGQLEREQNKRQVIQKMTARLEKGYYVFAPPTGYRFKKTAEHGKLLVRDEPAASIIAEAMEGYACGRFSMIVEVQRFLEKSVYYPHIDKKGRVHPTRVKEMLTCHAYAGYVGKQDWGVSLRKGKHEGLVSFETFEKIQKRLNETVKVPARKDIHADFPLRGFILCDDCGRPLTSCWSQGKNEKFPYYMCYNKDCESKGKSIPRDRLEGEFEALLQTMRPTQPLFDLLASMFKDAWDQQAANTTALIHSAKHKIVGIEKQIEQLVDRVVEATVPSAVTRYEQRIAQLEKEKLLMSETLTTTPPQGRFEELFEHALNFLSNPYKLWAFGELAHKRTVLKLAFADRLTYNRKTGLRTPHIAQPFRVFDGLSHKNFKMVGHR
jgi:DNA invertase Pin-like site-specific DNA recombinase